ncbi:hypothetical protein [Cupriavidus nantongensis]|uniref:hypothetical protein n=1 Tax=Cupriavidus nantongensis TaxID=1796606 RepID=UPI000AF354FA|nr:hypothetical protein [Cupriavidus nantongensis]
MKAMKKKRVVFAADFLMTKVSEQVSNLRWVKDLLARPVRDAVGLTPYVLCAQFNKEFNFDRSRFFALCGLELDAFATQAYFNAADVADEALKYVSQWLSPDDLVIGYELSEQTKHVLDVLGIKYIDFWLHPVRFLDDVLFGFTSNCPKIQARIATFDTPAALFYSYADRLKVQAYRGFRRVNFIARENSALFIGQTLGDKGNL